MAIGVMAVRYSFAQNAEREAIRACVSICLNRWMDSMKSASHCRLAGLSWMLGIA